MQSNRELMLDRQSSGARGRTWCCNKPNRRFSLWQAGSRLLREVTISSETGYESILRLSRWSFQSRRFLISRPVLCSLPI